MKLHESIRPCAVCGSFYPAEDGVLRQQIDSLLDSVPHTTYGSRIRGIISPHAGYLYSGHTAAYAFAQIREMKYNTVVIVSPSHLEYFDGISIFPGDAYQTPLGSVMVDDRIRSRLLESSPTIWSSFQGHHEEHAIEVQLPFLQVLLPEFKIVPIVMGDQRREYCFSLGEALAEVLQGEDCLLVASTDLSHYYTSEIARTLDAVFIQNIQDFDYRQLMADLEGKLTEGCGGGPTVAVLAALDALGVKNIEVVHHCNSGDVTGDHHKVVGYMSAVAYS